MEMSAQLEYFYVIILHQKQEALYWTLTVARHSQTNSQFKTGN